MNGAGVSTTNFWFLNFDGLPFDAENSDTEVKYTDCLPDSASKCYEFVFHDSSDPSVFGDWAQNYYVIANESGDYITNIDYSTAEEMIDIPPGGSYCYVRRFGECSGQPAIAPCTSTSPCLGSDTRYGGDGGDGGSGDKGAAAATGDPHIKTWSGEKFDFMGSCDLVMVKSESYGNGLGLEVQLRTQIRNGDNWSFISAVAIQIGDSTLEVDADGNFFLDGDANVDLFSTKLSGRRITWQSTRIKSGLTFQQFTVHLGTNGNSNEDEKFIIHVKHGLLNVLFENVESSDLGDSVGLMGSYKDGGALIGRDGHKIFDDYDLYGMEWQVRNDDGSDAAATLLTNIGLDEGVPQYSNQCVFPEAPKSLDERRRMLRGTDNSNLVRDAEKACASWPKDMIEACVFDVLATGDLSMAIQSPFE